MHICCRSWSVSFLLSKKRIRIRRSPGVFILYVNLGELEMNYFNENLEAEAIVRAASTIAVPKGRENGNVVEWMTEIGMDVPEFVGRRLHGFDDV